MLVLTLRRIVIVGLFTVISVAGIAAFGYARSNDGDAIHACFDNSNGQMRYIDPSKPGRLKGCKNQETALEWNADGPQGPPGVVDVYRASSMESVPVPNPGQSVLSVTVPSGAWVVSGTVYLRNPTANRIEVTCELDHFGAPRTYGGVVLAPFSVGSTGSNEMTMPLETVLDYSSESRTVHMWCRSAVTPGTSGATAWARGLTAIGATNVHYQAP